MRRLMTPFLAAFVFVLSVAAPAWAQDDAAEAEPAPVEAEGDFATQIDDWVGAYPNYYLGKTLFFDVMFWDDTLALGEGIGHEEVQDGETVEWRSYDAEKGYETRARRTLPSDVVLKLAGPEVRTIGQVQVEVRTGTRRDGETVTPILIGRVQAQPVDLAALELEPALAGTPDGDAITPVVSLAPFSVRVDRRSASLVETEVILPPGMLGLAAGDLVLAADHTEWVLDRQAEEGGGWVGYSPEATYSTAAIPNSDQANMPAVVLWLVLGSIFFTLRMRFVNLWAFWHAIRVTAGHYDNPEDEGEISHFQALSSALSATVGLGNIAGVAIAITAGGPGAIFWMIMAGFLGMTSKFTECTLGQMYRTVDDSGKVSGGPMYYLRNGLSEMGLAPLGVVTSWMFAIMCVGGSLGGGNMFQANQSFAQVAQAVPMLDASNGMHRLAYGVVLAVLVGVVIIGGIKRIGAAASMIVPAMCIVYVAAGLLIVVGNASAVPAAIGSIVSQAFTPAAGFGGLLGVLAQGFKRASFSSEAGVGSASIAHSAAQTPYPVREGIVALLEPFIDTIVVCATTGIVVVVTGVYTDPNVGTGVTMTSAAFDSVLPGFRYILTIAVVLFAFSTMISWSYYGERAVTWMFGEGVILPYRFVFLCFVVLGSLLTVNNVTDFSDMMILGMAFPNILGAVLLSGKVSRALNDYWAKLKNGEFKTA